MNSMTPFVKILDWIGKVSIQCSEVLREYDLTLVEGGITNEDEAVLVEWVRLATSSTPNNV